MTGAATATPYRFDHAYEPGAYGVCRRCGAESHPGPADTAAPTPARYTAQRLDAATGSAQQYQHGIWDTVTQAFVANELFASWSGAVSGAGRLNRAYEATRP